MAEHKLPRLFSRYPFFESRSEFLEAAIQSVLSQGYPNLEYIIIDGGSVDDSVNIIKKYEPYLSYWCSEPDGGHYEGLNKGFARSTGEVLTWLNSDDMYCPWAFRTVATIMTDLTEVEWLSTLQPGGWDAEGFCAGFGSIAGFAKDAFLDGRYLPNRNRQLGWIQQESTFWRRSLWEKADCRIDTDFRLAGDFELWSRFFLHSALYGVTCPLAGFRSHPNQRSADMVRYRAEAERALALMREKCGWSKDTFREGAYHLKLNQIPRVRHALDNSVGYRGKRISRVNGSIKAAHWATTDYSFI